MFRVMHVGVHARHGVFARLSNITYTLSHSFFSTGRTGDFKAAANDTPVSRPVGVTVSIGYT